MVFSWRFFRFAGIWLKVNIFRMACLNPFTALATSYDATHTLFAFSSFNE
jgi:hypothetical protein